MSRMMLPVLRDYVVYTTTILSAEASTISTASTALGQRRFRGDDDDLSTSILRTRGRGAGSSSSASTSLSSSLFSTTSVPTTTSAPYATSMGPTATYSTTATSPSPTDFEESVEQWWGNCPLPPYNTTSAVGTSHNAMLYLGIVCLVLATIMMAYLIFRHLTNYFKPREQRQIIKILVTPIVMAAVSVGCLINGIDASYVQPISYLYDAFAFPALFLLFVQFCVPDGQYGANLFATLYARASPGRREKKRIAKGKPIKGPKWIRTCWICVFQMPLVMVVAFLAQEITTSTGDFCEYSLSPRFGNLWVQILTNISLSVAIMAVITFERRLRSVMKVNKPMMKLLTFKAILGIPFTIQFFITILQGAHVFNPTAQLSYSDIRYGVPSVLASFLMLIISASFLFYFSHKEYTQAASPPPDDPSTSQFSPDPERLPFFWALLDAINPWDILLGVARAVQLLFGKIPGSEDDSIDDRSDRNNDMPGQGQIVQMRNMSVESVAPAPGHLHSYDPHGRLQSRFQETGLSHEERQWHDVSLDDEVGKDTDKELVDWNGEDDDRIKSVWSEEGVDGSDDQQSHHSTVYSVRHSVNPYAGIVRQDHARR